MEVRAVDLALRDELDELHKNYEANVETIHRIFIANLMKKEHKRLNLEKDAIPQSNLIVPHICWGCGCEYEHRDTFCSQCGRRVWSGFGRLCGCGKPIERNGNYIHNLPAYTYT